MGKINYKIQGFTDQYYISSTLSSDLKVFFTFGSDGITESPGTPNWSSEDIVGSTSPVKVYINNGARTVSYSHTFIDDYTTESLLTIRNKLSAMEYPMVNGGVTLPHIVRMRLGKIYIRGVVTSINFSWDGPIRNGTHIKLKVDLSVEESREESFDASDIIGGLWNSF